ncbi:MAG TPA: oligosaccharide flippase family protein [Burkholderiaceae bacterium]
MNFAVLKRNALHMLGAQFSAALFQGLQFILIARALGAHDFGRMAGVLAITSILLPFSGLGSGNVMVMRLARQEAAAALCFGNALLVAAVSGGLLVALAALLAPLFLRDPSLLGLVLLLGVSEVLMTKFIDIASHVFYGLDRHALSGAFYCMQAGARLCAALLFHTFFAHRGVEFWAAMHLASGVVVALIVLWMTTARIGRPTLDVRLALREIKVGVLFSIGLSANSVYTDIDKAVLARYENPQINGQYTAAYRLVYMAFTPVMAVLLATQGLFFRIGSESGVSATFRLATRVAWLGAAYCIGLAVLLYAASPLVVWALGAQYTLSVEILRTLALLPLALMAQSVFSEALTGADRQRARSFAQVTVALACFALNMVLVPRLGWQGAVIATYCSQIGLAALVIGLIWVSVRGNA